jgi:dimethylaniline monooxygenase (N-oxide forming)
MAAYAPLLQQMGTGDFAHVKSVGVVGAGVAGLQMCRALMARGYSVTVFDRAPKVGGLWQKNYDGYGVQVPKQLYEFPDYPLEKVAWGEYATGPQTQAYIESYADSYDLRKCLRLNTEVVQLKKRADGQKGHTFVLAGGDAMDFDFAVIATGMYSQKPNLPVWAEGDTSAFKGQVLHSSQYFDPSVCKGKKVIVIGSCKSAHDCTESAANVASEPPTMLFRSAHWSTPRLIAGLIPFQYVFLSRLGQALVSWYKGGFPSGGPCYCTVCCYILYPIMWVAFKLVTLIFSVQRGHWGEYRPETDLVSDFFGYAMVLAPDFLYKWRAGKLTGKKGEVAKLVADGVELKSGEKLQADIIICATGFKKTYDYLENKAQLDIQDDGHWLYRHMIPKNVRDLNMAFCGSEVATITNIMTYAIHAEYICRMLKNELTLPSVEDMEAEVERMKAWKRSWMPETGSRASLVLLYQTHYHDRLLMDMGETPGRKCGPCELLCPYGPHDYDGIIKSD